MIEMTIASEANVLEMELVVEIVTSTESEED